MFIINTASFARTISYTKDQHLRPGQMSRPLPIETIHNKMLWKDLGNGFAVVRLTEEERDFLKRVLNLDALPADVQPVKKVDPPKAPPPKNNPVAANVPVQPLVKPEVPVTDGLLPIPGAQPSLQDLQRLNAASPKLNQIKSLTKSPI